MTNEYYDEAVNAFKAIGAEIYKLDSYTHVHGPNHPCNRGNGKCTNHLAVIEFNGSVAPHKSIAKAMGGAERPQQPISQHVLGYSRGSGYGNFGFGFDTVMISKRWSGYTDFAKAVAFVARHQELKHW